MKEADEQGMLLGRNTPIVDSYAPQLLFRIPRQSGRQLLGLGDNTPFYGADLWHAYEMSWLDGDGKPVVRVGRFTIPASSACMVESKSFKLYLNSLNNTRFATEAELVATIKGDLASTVGADIELELLGPADPRLAGSDLAGFCLDELPLSTQGAGPVAELLQIRSEQVVEERLYSHLLRSLCPVTGQPDWASVWVHYRGMALEHGSLLGYIVAYRQHQEFHEQCVERMFCDLHQRCSPEFLHVQAFYTRRGGLDINPFRSTDVTALPLPRLNRQ